MSKTVFQIFVLIFLLAAPFTAHAEAAGWVSGEHVQARLVPVLGNSDDDVKHALLEVRLSEGWHTYWKVPGDSGLPPRFDWSASQNINDIVLTWPAPARIDEFGLQVFGYKGEISWPVSFQIAEPSQSATLAVDMDIMVCHEVCIPEKLALQTLVSDLTNEALTHSQKLYDFKAASVPISGDTPALKIETATLGPEALVLNVYSQKGFDNTDIFAITEDIGLTAIPQKTVDAKDSRKAMITIPKPPEADDFAVWMQGRTLEITIVAGRSAIVRSFQF